MTETTLLEAKLRKMTEAVTPGWYAGRCKVCDHDTYVAPGVTWATCQSCGASSYARDHLETVLAEARGWVARPKALAEAIVALVDTEQSVTRLYERIRKWGAREDKRTKDGTRALRGIVSVRRLDADGDPSGPKRYALGDVLDMLNKEGETRVTETIARAS